MGISFRRVMMRKIMIIMIIMITGRVKAKGGWTLQISFRRIMIIIFLKNHTNNKENNTNNKQNKIK